ncbi:PREDICTED: C-type lectin domain family 4 member F-like, partial [Gekko japonicus]|uniref:C-type lectin domain family 4 member F-like n=1 Tax=Gekko japonicus TaxID=146911 RepID=A0ABM1L1K5_GEKJA
MAENIYENLQRAQREGITLKEPTRPPPSKRSTSIITLLAILTLLLAVLLTAVTVLFFQKERTLQAPEGLAPKYSISLHLCNVSNASLEESKRFQPLQNVSVSFSEIQACLESAVASQTSLQERYGTLLGLVSAGWRFHNGSFYFFSQETKHWQEAEETCVSHGAHLTSVASKEEMEFLVREGKGKTFWIGLTDQREEGNWTWTDGTTYNHQRTSPVVFFLAVLVVLLAASLVAVGTL